MSSISQQEDTHSHCVACGPVHLIPSLGLRFEWLDQNTIHSRFFVDKRYQGYDTILHGGVSSTLLDAAMTHHLIDRQIEAMTADLQVRFMIPVKVGLTVSIYAMQQRQKHGVYWMSSLLYSEEHGVHARAKARFMLAHVAS
ncbi:PaaI family thioesterase [Celerinatantimonas yamalensis]|uniref:Acyl-coenzyme A thioesterase THEM4 n=1 Tax=Celerinatantimonas yamalensis TaxID=559956 RepID=A0ABW9G295_9GAMM